MFSSPLLVLSLAAIAAVASDAPSGSMTPQEQASYLYGRKLIRTVEKMDLDTAALVQGLLDAKAGRPSALPGKDAQTAMDAWTREVGARELRKRTAHLAANKAWLAENARKPGVKTTASGLQYRVIASGKGRKPSATDEVVVNYRGALLDGAVFGSSEKQNGRTTLKVNQTIKGWAEALPMMQEGDKWELFVPAELAYGNLGSASVRPDQVLVFQVELLEVGGKKEAKP